MTDISIIIPAYNRLWSLKETIASCRDNSCMVEIIVIDDGSTDGTSEWLSQQEGLTVIRQSNLGKCAAVNRGFSIACGKYIRFLDADDLLPPKANDEQFALAEAEQSDICVSGYKNIDLNGNVIRGQRWMDCDDFISQQLGECDSSHYSAYLFRREFIADIPHRADYAFRDDRLFVLEGALEHPCISIHRGYGLLHRIHDCNRLQDRTGPEKTIQNDQHYRLYRLILGRLKERNELTPRRIKAAINILWPLAQWTAMNDIPSASGILAYIYELDPDFIVPEKGLKKFLFRVAGFTGAQRLLRIFRAFKSGIK